jgi:hypothetical protein
MYIKTAMTLFAALMLGVASSASVSAASTHHHATCYEHGHKVACDAYNHHQTKCYAGACNPNWGSGHSGS